MKATHAIELEGLGNKVLKLEAENSNLKTSHTSELATLKETHKTEISNLKASHSTEISNLKATFRTEMEKKEKEMEELKAIISELRGQIEKRNN